MYQMSIPFVPLENESKEERKRKGTPKNLFLALSVDAAADKVKYREGRIQDFAHIRQYLMPGLEFGMLITMRNCVFYTEIAELVSFARALLDGSLIKSFFLLVLATEKIAQGFKELLSLPEAWNDLSANADLLKIAIEWSMSIQENRDKHTLELAPSNFLIILAGGANNDCETVADLMMRNLAQWHDSGRFLSNRQDEQVG